MSTAAWPCTAQDPQIVNLCITAQDYVQDLSTPWSTNYYAGEAQDAGNALFALVHVGSERLTGQLRQASPLAAFTGQGSWINMAHPNTDPVFCLPGATQNGDLPTSSGPLCKSLVDWLDSLERPWSTLRR